MAMVGWDVSSLWADSWPMLIGLVWGSLSIKWIGWTVAMAVP